MMELSGLCYVALTAVVYGLLAATEGPVWAIARGAQGGEAAAHGGAQEEEVVEGVAGWQQPQDCDQDEEGDRRQLAQTPPLAQGVDTPEEGTAPSTSAKPATSATPPTAAAPLSLAIVLQDVFAGFGRGPTSCAPSSREGDESGAPGQGQRQPQRRMRAPRPPPPMSESEYLACKAAALAAFDAFVGPVLLVWLPAALNVVTLLTAAAAAAHAWRTLAVMVALQSAAAWPYLVMRPARALRAKALPRAHSSREVLLMGAHALPCPLLTAALLTAAIGPLPKRWGLWVRKV